MRFFRSSGFLLAAIAVLALVIRIEQRETFAGTPQFWGTTAVHLALSRGLAEGKPFHLVESDRKVALEFLFEQEGAFKRSLSEYDRMAEVSRPASSGTEYVPYFGDQGGWAALIFFARFIPGVNTLSDISTIQILIDIGALLLLYPLGIFVTGKRWVAILICLFYAINLPVAYAAARPWRDLWPGFGVVYAMGLMLPAWKRGPASVGRSMGWLVAAGVVVGLATYGRSTAVTIPVSLFLITMFCWKRPGPSVLAGATVTAAMLITLAPWITVSMSSAGVASLTSSAGGHAALAGLGEEETNPMGLRFDDRATSVYVREVCGYPVEYMSYAYHAACAQEARRFIRDNRGWYASLVGRRIGEYLYRARSPRLTWGVGNRIHIEFRMHAERWLPILALLGIGAGFFFYPRAWIPLVWIMHFWVFILPIQSHPRLLLGSQWALVMGVAMLIGVVVLAAIGFLHRSGKPSGRKSMAEEIGSTQRAGKPPAGRVWIFVVAGVFLVNIVAGSLLILKPPRTPDPDRNWREDLASENVSVRLAVVERSQAVASDAKPILVAALTNDNPEVRARAQAVIAGFRTQLGSFSPGQPSDLKITSMAQMELAKDSEAKNGHSMRMSVPGTRGRPLFLVGLRAVPGRGEYRIRFRARLDTPVSLVFLSSDFETVYYRRGFDLKGFPMSGYRVAEFGFPSPGELDSVVVLFEISRLAPEGQGTVRMDFDWITAWHERGSVLPGM